VVGKIKKRRAYSKFGAVIQDKFSGMVTIGGEQIVRLIQRTIMSIVQF